MQPYYKIYGDLRSLLTFTIYMQILIDLSMAEHLCLRRRVVLFAFIPCGLEVFEL